MGIIYCIFHIANYTLLIILNTNCKSNKSGQSNLFLRYNHPLHESLKLCDKVTQRILVWEIMDKSLLIRISNKLNRQDQTQVLN